jgi:4-amino-4-deoxy-L-arabinose transferase-like glycosyltransferase/tetratricopeptide (TPR) repeat protein
MVNTDQTYSTDLDVSNQTPKRIILLFIIAVALGLRVWNISWGLPEFYEEGIPLRASWDFWNWGKEGISLNPSVFVYPAFTFYLQFLIQSIHYFIGNLVGVYHGLASFQQAFDNNPTAFVLIARVTTIVFDLGTVIVAYEIGKSCLDRRAGLLAAMFIALNPLHIQEAHLINVDTPLAFFVMLSIFFTHKIYASTAKKWYILSGIAIGLAAATKYNGAILLGVLILAHTMRSKSWKQAVKSLKSSSLAVVLILSGVTFVLTNPYIIIRFKDFMATFSEVQRHMETGHLGLDKGTSTAGYYFLDSLPRSMGWPLLIASAASVIYILVRMEKKYILFLAFPAFYVGTISTWEMRADRYIFPAVPVLMLISAVGICKFMDWYTLHPKKPSLRLLPVSTQFSKKIIFVVGLAVLLWPLKYVLEYQRSLSLPDTRALTKEWIKSHEPPMAAIATGPFGIDLTNIGYFVLPIPFNAGGTEKTIPFYNSGWYEDLDLVITSDYDYGRYIEEPARFREILDFYDTVHASWNFEYEMHPGKTQSGPTFWLYKPPSSRRDLFDTEMIKKVEKIADSSEAVNFFGKLAEILSQKGKFQKSEQLLIEVIQIDSTNERVQRDLVYIEYKLHHNELALGLVQSYLMEHPGDADRMAIEGNILFDLNRFDEAEPILNEALRLNNRMESAYLTLNLVYARRGDKEKMIDLLSRYLTILPPNSSRAQQVEQTLSRLKK